jgi:hypothetical protein
MTACGQVKEVSDKTLPFEKHIKFNHLYIVLDDSTYNYLSDSLSFIKQFSGFKASSTNTATESWSGKYLYGKNHYLEIFKPKGYKGAAVGDFGMGFMPNKLGTLDTLYNHWRTSFDTVSRTDKNIVEKGVTYKWFTSLSIPAKDSLKLHIWLMEHSKEEMLYAGFKEEELTNEVEYWDYLRYMRAKTTKSTPDSIKYDKLFDRVNSVTLKLSNKELSFLRKNLLHMGFVERNRVFQGNDMDVKYEVTEAPHFILQQIDFKLARSTMDENIVLNRLTIKVSGNKASFTFNY